MLLCFCSSTLLDSATVASANSSALLLLLLVVCVRHGEPDSTFHAGWPVARCTPLCVTCEERLSDCVRLAPPRPTQEILVPALGEKAASPKYSCSLLPSRLRHEADQGASLFTFSHLLIGLEGARPSAKRAARSLQLAVQRATHATWVTWCRCGRVPTPTQCPQDLRPPVTFAAIGPSASNHAGRDTLA